jgi:hypothetical protein
MVETFIRVAVDSQSFGDYQELTIGVTHLDRLARSNVSPRVLCPGCSGGAVFTEQFAGA